jgi:hypothetical protein
VGLRGKSKVGNIVSIASTESTESIGIRVARHPPENPDHERYW